MITENMDYVFEDAFVREQVAEMNVPEYDKNGVVVKYVDAVGRLDSYLNIEYRADPLKLPIMKIDGQTWMSLTPMEVVSQEVAARMMTGEVGIMGIGLGYIAWRAMKNPDVDFIHLFERDERVIEYFEDTFKNYEGYDKINIVKGDVQDRCKNWVLDVLYNDTYPTMLPDAIVDDITFFTSENQVDNYRFWGQERVYLDAILNGEYHLKHDISRLDSGLLASWSRDEERLGLYRPICDEDFYSQVLNALENVE